MNKLEKRVKSMVTRYAGAYSGKNKAARIQAFMADLRQGGCASGTVGELIYYCDTSKFYHHCIDDINDLLAVLIDDGYDYRTIDGYDADDPLCLYGCNQQILVWLAFEETAMSLFPDAQPE